ncbi:MAG: hypothetical protein HY303_02445 [Candidatus Wallbacteria bacterium]|nr:hypothetical protein [Candidatus Wallbacteria bacterium]
MIFSIDTWLQGLLSHTWLYFLAFFVNWFIPAYLVALGARTVLLETRGLMVPRTAGHLGAATNRAITIVLASFLPGWIAAMAEDLLLPGLHERLALLLALGAGLCVSGGWYYLVLRRRSALDRETTRTCWHALPMAGFGWFLLLAMLERNPFYILMMAGCLCAPGLFFAFLPTVRQQLEALTPRSEAGDRCVLCREDIEAPGVTCAGCRDRYHLECWTYKPGCGRKDCPS